MAQAPALSEASLGDDQLQPGLTYINIYYHHQTFLLLKGNVLEMETVVPLFQEVIEAAPQAASIENQVHHTACAIDLNIFKPDLPRLLFNPFGTRSVFIF